MGAHQGADSSQPVVFRRCTQDGHTYLYVVNDTPLATTARLRVEASPTCRIEELSGRRKVAPLRPQPDSALYWQVELEPYDLVAVRLSEPDVPCSNLEVAWPVGVEAALASRIRCLGAQAAALRNPPALQVVANPGFEQQPTRDGSIPEWGSTRQAGTSIQLDRTQKHGGQQSIKMVSKTVEACLVSRPMVVPSTGRLAVSVWFARPTARDNRRCDWPSTPSSRAATTTVSPRSAWAACPFNRSGDNTFSRSTICRWKA